MILVSEAQDIPVLISSVEAKIPAARMFFFLLGFAGTQLRNA